MLGRGRHLRVADHQAAEALEMQRRRSWTTARTCSRACSETHAPALHKGHKWARRVAGLPPHGDDPGSQIKRARRANRGYRMKANPMRLW